MNLGARLAAAVLAAALASAGSAQPSLFHDHGFGLAFSADGRTLFAPSHGGLAAYEDGAWWEAPGPAQGFSGFSVTEGAAWSSGHAQPDAPASRPAGLMRSTDGGRTWRSVALAGEADFHLVAAGHRSGAIYVLNLKPNTTMPVPGVYVTRDQGANWRRAAARGLTGEIHGIAAHPADPGVVAVGSGQGLYLSRDGGETFRRVDSRGPVTALAFDVAGERLRYARALAGEISSVSLKGAAGRALRLPPLAGDYVTSIAQSPADQSVLAFATRRRDVFLSVDAAASWRRIAAAGAVRPRHGEGEGQEEHGVR